MYGCAWAEIQGGRSMVLEPKRKNMRAAGAHGAAQRRFAAHSAAGGGARRGGSKTLKSRVALCRIFTDLMPFFTEIDHFERRDPSA